MLDECVALDQLEIFWMRSCVELVLDRCLAKAPEASIIDVRSQNWCLGLVSSVLAPLGLDVENALDVNGLVVIRRLGNG